MGETGTTGREQEGGWEVGGGALTPTSPSFLSTNRALKAALITKAIRLIFFFGGPLVSVITAVEYQKE